MKISLFAFSILLLSISGWSQTYYEGKLGPLTFGLKTDLPKQQASIYIPEQGLFEYTISAPVFRNDSLLAEFSDFKSSLYGKLDADSFSGFWKQNGFPSPLKLDKVEVLSFMKRPQIPQPPFPYEAENVKFFNVDQSVTFGGTLTFPKGKGPFTTVILISGSGQQDRDETIFGHKSFWVIADHLSRNGFAVLRVDDRGIGETVGPLGTSADYARDVLTALDYLKTRKEVNKKKIGLIGHSEGGMIAPLAASQSKEVAFIISLAGLGVTGKQLLLQQNDDILQKSGTNETYRGHVRSLNETLYHVLDRLPLEGDVKDSLQTAFVRWIKNQSEEVLGQMGYKSEQGRKSVTRQFDTMNSKWYRYFVKYDPMPVLSQLTIPVLALNGSKDLQVAAKPNLAGFEKALTQAGNKHFKIVELPDLNHLFQTCRKCTVAEYGMLEETFSPEALKLMTDWLKER